MVSTLGAFEIDAGQGCAVLTGNNNRFVAAANINKLAGKLAAGFVLAHSLACRSRASPVSIETRKNAGDPGGRTV